MPSKKKELPYYDRSNLADELSKVWRYQGPLKGFSNQNIGPEKLHDMETGGGKVLVKHYGTVQVLYFNDEKTSDNEARYTFYVHNVGINSTEREQVASFIESRLNDVPDTKKKKIAKIFGSFSVEASNVEFGDKKRKRKVETFRGVLVKVPILELPRGKEGHVSGDFFELLFNLYVLPSMRVIERGKAPGKDFWYEFADKYRTRAS